MSWLVIAASGSAIVVGFLFAVRMTPLLVIGGIAGALADRMSRSELLAATNTATTVVYIAVAGGLLAGLPTLPVLFAATVTLGCLDGIRLTSTSTLVVDASPGASAPRAIATSQISSRVGAGIGGLLFGLILASGGSAAAFGVAALLSGASAAILWRTHVQDATPSPRQGFVRDIRDGLGLMARHRAVAWLAIIAITAEILGFSNDGILPVFATQVLSLGAEGLGLLYLAVRFGSVVGLLLLVRSGARLSGVSLLVLLLVFGLSLVGFGTSTSVPLSLLLLAIAGSAASCIDALEQSILQHVVDDSERGRAMGLWTICLGFGPFGFVAIGALAGVFGAQLGQILAGGAMALAAVVIALSPGTVRELRQARTAKTELEPGVPSLVE